MVWNGCGAMLEKGAARLVVLEDGGGYAGYCFSYVEKDIGHLDQLYVDPGYRGGGWETSS
jgi:ribosomal protein S18 acetylase RimI-like enzyme